MIGVLNSLRDWSTELRDGWNRFWFTPSPPQTLAVIRILAGAMLFYTHLVWSLQLHDFLGADSWVSHEAIREIHRESFVWSYLWYLESPAVLWSVHLLGLVVFALLALGLFTRPAAVLAWGITLSYCHRLTGALFGLDQVNVMLSMYLMLGTCGDAYSLDRWRRRRKSSVPLPPPRPRIGTNLAIRLIQVHMCVVYLFAGIGKMRGELWWDGSALWYSLANLEYQSLDMTWLIDLPWLIALFTHLTVFWETFYCVLIWPRATRWIMLSLAIVMHAGIALCLGMMTFGLAMLFANLAFVPAETMRAAVEWGRRRIAAVMLQPSIASSGSYLKNRSD